MPARALIVLLLTLNLGVALWWAMREAPGPAPQPSLPAGAEPLRLLDERDRSGSMPAPVLEAGVPAIDVPGAAPQEAAAVDAGAAGPASSQLAPDPLLGPAPPDPPWVAEARRCHRFGPFPDAAAASRAAAALGPAVLRQVVHETPAAVQRWDVRTAALPDRAAAEALVARLRAAGFSDHYLLPAADDGSVEIALGRFSTRDGAQRHRAALEAAGFNVVSAAGDAAAPAQHWIHAVLAKQAEPATLQRAAGAAQGARIDCAVLETPDR